MAKIIDFPNREFFAVYDNDIEEKWSQLKKRIIRKNPAIGRTLHLAKLIKSDGNAFHIAFSPEDRFAQRVIMTHKNLKWIERVFAPMNVVVIDAATTNADIEAKKDKPIRRWSYN